MDRWRMLVAIQDDDDNSPWFDDHRNYRDCRFEPDSSTGGAWSVPAGQKAWFIERGLPVGASGTVTGNIKWVSTRDDNPEYVQMSGNTPPKTKGVR
jgi:hypothetical protein